MKPLVFYAQTQIFGQFYTFWHIIKRWDARPGSSRCTRVQALRTIAKYDLPLAYEDENGRIWADPDENPYKEIRERKTKKGEERRMLSLKRNTIVNAFFTGDWKYEPTGKQKKQGDTPHRN